MNITKIKPVEPVKSSFLQSRAKKTTKELVEIISQTPFGTTHTIYDMIENAKRTKKPTYEVNGMTLGIDTEHKVIVVNGADMKDKDTIVVGLTNGYQLGFTMDDIQQVRGMLSMFCPEDIRRILSAIAQANYKKKKEVEIEKDRLYMGEAADKDKDQKKQRVQKEEEEKRQQEDTFKKMAADTVSGSFLYHLNPETRAEHREKEEAEREENEQTKKQQDDITENMIQQLMMNRD